MKMYDFSERTICQKLPYMKPHKNFVCKFKASHYNTTIMYATPLRIGHSVSPGVPEMIYANVTDIYPDLKVHGHQNECWLWDHSLLPGDTFDAYSACRRGTS
jgi:hypothetical protein